MSWTASSRCWTGRVPGVPSPADHTVVGFFGATGSGKSSLFNAVSGEEIATAAARRPTTSEPLAGIWGAEGSDELLDWLEVRNRHHATPVPGFADDGTGLILLDLPDFDSTRAANREIVERMVGLVDVLVWVLDPQKYADAAVHNDFLDPAGLPRRRHPGGAEPDRPAPGAGRSAGPGVPQRHPGAGRAGQGAGHWRLRRRWARGVDKVRAAIRQVATQRQAQSQRLGADVTRAARPACRGVRRDGGRRPGSTAASKARLAEELAVAANVPLVVDAVVRSYRLEATRRTGWPVTRWLAGSGPIRCGG